jgi:membrane protease subunit (stomatin/prohibitin family)
VPSAISLFLFWPLLVTQIIGLIRQSHLDDESVSCVEDSLKARAAQAPTASAPPPRQQRFCVECGTVNGPGSAFCVKCGVKLPGPGQLVQGAS